MFKTADIFFDPLKFFGPLPTFITHWLVLLKPNGDKNKLIIVRQRNGSLIFLRELNIEHKNILNVFEKDPFTNLNLIYIFFVSC